VSWLRDAEQRQAREDGAAMAQYIYDVHTWGREAAVLASMGDEFNHGPIDVTRAWYRGIQADILCRFTWPVHDESLLRMPRYR